MAEGPEIAKQQWDVIIIGTGMGGATLGYALAQTGQRVLFCEKGKSQLSNRQATRGTYPELFFPYPQAPKPEHRDILSCAGRYCDEIEDHTLTRPRPFIPFMGSGTGGSSALYGMAMERFFPADFEPKRNYSMAPDTTLPAQWPISYTELAPYYKAAEDLYRIRGTVDPLREFEPREPLKSPPPLTSLGSEIFYFFQKKGFHPYRLPMACEFVPGCRCCQGYLCDRNCKNDSSRLCLEPAISIYGAELLDECEVLRLESTRTKVTGVICSWRGKEMTLRGKIIALAAGALESPGILLRSNSTSWPQGLANDSGLVGRNLMRHYTDLYVLSPKARAKLDNRYKEFAFNDFYYVNGKKLGTVQSFGRLPPASALAAVIEKDLQDGPLPWTAALFKLVKPLVTRFINQKMEKGIILATIMEDLPYADNRIRLAPDSNRHSGIRLRINYKIHSHDRERIKVFRTLMKETLKPYRFMKIKQAENNQSLAHVCGTCRFGTDPKESVLNVNNQAHGLDNLYVVDSSFFPSSAGTNPSLTIAANALRVATYLTGCNVELTR